MKTFYYGGDIVTLDKKYPQAEAVLVEDGKIIAIGSFNEIIAEIKGIGSVQIHNLQGKTMLPGFIDAHGHMAMVAEFVDYAYLASPPLGHVASIEDLVRILKKHGENSQSEKNKWIIGYAYDHTMLKEKRHPDRFDLDRVSQHRPVMIFHDSLHRGSLNSYALELLGIQKDTPNPSGGFISRQENGEPDGILEENAFTEAMEKLPKLTLQERVRQIEQSQKIYASRGITTVQEGATRSHQLEPILCAAQEKRLFLDVISYPLEEFGLKKLAESPVGVYKNHLKLGGLKIFLDGGIPPQTAWLSQPYQKVIGGKEPGYCGYPIRPDNEVVEFFKNCIKNDWQIMAHAIGDRTCDQFLNGYEQAVKECGEKKGKRPVMLHVTAMREDQLEKVRENDILLSFFNGALHLFGDYYVEVSVGEERAQKLIPIAQALQKGISVTLHQDPPVSPPNMLHSIWSAVTRTTRSGRQLGMPITVLDALKGVTINAAYQYFEENEKGSISVGKKADFVILDKNPLKVPLSEILKIKILTTIKEDMIVWEAQ